MPSKSKAKGNNNEYDVRDRLSAWYGKPFSKTPNSGAMRWNGNLWTYGDLIPPEELHWVFECKHYSEVTFDDMLGRRTNKSKKNLNPCPEFGTGLVADWWYSQTVVDAERATEELGFPVEGALIFKQDHHRHRLVIDEDIYRAISNPVRRTLVCCWCYIPNKNPFVAFDFENFLSKVTPAELFVAFEKIHGKAVSSP